MAGVGWSGRVAGGGWRGRVAGRVAGYGGGATLTKLTEIIHDNEEAPCIFNIHEEMKT